MSRILVLVLLCAPSLLVAADGGWHWVKVGNNADHAWDISKGDAEVTIENGRVSAKLFLESSSKGVQTLLTGSVTNGRLVVTETVQGSDFSGSKYTGTLTTQKWKEAFGGATGIETITLSDGFGMIGLTRTIKK